MTDRVLMGKIQRPPSSGTKVIRAVSIYLNGKLFEWFAALNLCFIGIVIIVFPSTLSTTAFKYLLSLSTTANIIGIGCFLVGYARVIALIVNGSSWVYGPRVRAWCASLSAIIWLQFWISLAQFAVADAGVPTIGLSNWGLLFFGEIIVAYRAATDVRSKQ